MRVEMHSIRLRQTEGKYNSKNRHNRTEDDWEDYKDTSAVNADMRL